MSNFLEKFHNFLSERSDLYLNYYRNYYTRGCSPTDLEFKWRPFNNVTDALKEWKRVMASDDYDDWHLWMALNLYREHDEMGYFPDYPNDQNY